MRSSQRYLFFAGLAYVAIKAISTAASAYFAAGWILLSLTSMIIDKHLKNCSIRITLSFKYKEHYRTVRVHKKVGKKHIKTKWYSIYNGEWKVNLRG
jgi:hypothetical protein